jgi:hypothetical protein
VSTVDPKLAVRLSEPSGPLRVRRERVTRARDAFLQQPFASPIC